MPRYPDCDELPAYHLHAMETTLAGCHGIPLHLILARYQRDHCLLLIMTGVLLVMLIVSASMSFGAGIWCVSTLLAILSVRWITHLRHRRYLNIDQLRAITLVVPDGIEFVPHLTRDDGDLHACWWLLRGNVNLGRLHQSVGYELAALVVRTTWEEDLRRWLNLPPATVTSRPPAAIAMPRPTSMHPERPTMIPVDTAENHAQMPPEPLGTRRNDLEP